MSFKKMSMEFQMAFGLTNTKCYDAAIELYEEDLKENPKNIASMNNIALCKINQAISRNDKTLLTEAIKILNKAIDIVNHDPNYKYGFPIAEANLKWAKELMEQ